MFFYTDAAKLDLGAIGVILLAGRTVDAVFSPVMGFIVDRTDTCYGKCRPFIAAGILPVCPADVCIILFTGFFFRTG